MIRVTIQLLPKGDESRARTLGVLEIANDATGDAAIGNYTGTLHAEYTRPGGRLGRVVEFNRRQQSVWSLVGAFLKLWGHTKHSPTKMTMEIPKVCSVCRTPGCIEARGAGFHKGTAFGSLKCDYSGQPPFAGAEWANDPDPLCLWCAGTGHPYGDESYGMCECPKVGEARMMLLGNGNEWWNQGEEIKVLVCDRPSTAALDFIEHLMRYVRSGYCPVEMP